MAKKSSETLEEGLNRSANKRGFTGKERHRYIGGALHNMGKSKPRSGGTSKTSHKAPTIAPRAHHTPTVHKVEAPKKKAYTAGSLTKQAPREKLVLTVKENKKASEGKPYKLYSIYNQKTGAMHGSGTYRKPKIAKDEAKIEMDSHNHPFGEHTRGRLA